LPSKAKRKATTQPKTRTTRKRKTAATDTSVKSYDYRTLLKRAREQIPREVFEHRRFQVPRADTFIQGTRTVIRNFKDIVDTLRREPQHLLRYLARELATAGEIRGRQAIFNGRFSASSINELIKRYTNQYVVCPVCNRPDTEIRREERLLLLVCTACGARTPLKAI